MKTNAKRGRPKGRSRDNRSFGPLGDLLRKYRLEKRLGLMDVAEACGCSVQFVSNIEHGRAPLPWDKVESLANFLKISVDELQAANLAVRADFKSFVGMGKTGKMGKSVKGMRVAKPAALGGLSSNAASAMAYTAKDDKLREIIQLYQNASSASKKKFVKAAVELLSMI